MNITLKYLKKLPAFIWEGLLRLLTLGCGAFLGGVCAYAAFKNGMNMHDGELGVAFGCGFAAVVALSWLMWPIAKRMKSLGSHSEALVCKIAWVPLAAFTVFNAMMFVAQYRSDMVQGKGFSIEQYDTAKTDRGRLIADLNTVHQNPVWTASSGCTAKAPGARKLCDRAAELERQVRDKDIILRSGRPGQADPGAEFLGWFLNSRSGWVANAWVALAALALELSASFSIKLALSPWGPAKLIEETDQQEQVEAEPTVIEVPPADSEALTQMRALVLASPNAQLVASGRKLAKTMGVARATFAEWLNKWHDQGHLKVERKGGRTIVALPSKKAA